MMKRKFLLLFFIFPLLGFSITPLVSPTTIPGATLWLFAVGDSQERIVLSAENPQRPLMVAWFDKNNPTQVSWKSIVSPAEIGGSSISDHWHLFAHGAHWISFSISEAHTSYLVKLDENLNRLWLKKVVGQLSLEEIPGYSVNKKGIMQPPNGKKPYLPTPYLPTNDHFMVPTDNGVAIGYFLPAYGHYVMEINQQGEVAQRRAIGDGEFAHGNGASAIKLSDGYLVITGRTINHLAYSPLLGLYFDKEWNPIRVVTLVAQEKTNFSMTSVVKLASDKLVVVSRMYEQAYPEGKLPPPPPLNSSREKPLPDDAGKIVRFVFDSNHTLLLKEVLVDKPAFRPHLTLVGDQLITTWDGRGIYLRMDMIKTQEK